MFPGYHRSFWVHAGRVVAVRADIPARTLAVDAWEMHDPIAPGVRLLPPPAWMQTPGRPRTGALPLTQEGYEGFPGRGSLVPPEESLLGEGFYGPYLVGV